MTTQDAGADSRSHKAREAILWLAVACILAAAIGFSWNPTPFAQALAAVFIACALVHAGFFYGLRSAPILFVICVAITFVVENIGAATGIPFGHYHFEVDAGLPHIGSIPIIVGPLWFGAGYFSWVVASTTVRRRRSATGQTTQPDRSPHCCGVRHDTMGFGDGSARIHHRQGLDMA